MHDGVKNKDYRVSVGVSDLRSIRGHHWALSLFVFLGCILIQNDLYAATLVERICADRLSGNNTTVPDSNEDGLEMALADRVTCPSDVDAFDALPINDGIVLPPDLSGDYTQIVPGEFAWIGTGQVILSLTLAEESTNISGIPVQDYSGTITFKSFFLVSEPIPNVLPFQVRVVTTEDYSGAVSGDITWDSLKGGTGLLSGTVRPEADCGFGGGIFTVSVRPSIALDGSVTITLDLTTVDSLPLCPGNCIGNSIVDPSCPLAVERIFPTPIYGAPREVIIVEPDPIQRELESVEVTPIQALANTENQDLVANKNMIVRVHARLDEDDGPTPLPIKVVLCVTNVDPNCELSKEVTGMVYGTNHEFTLDERLKGEDSLNIWVFGRLADLLDAAADREPQSHSFQIVLSSPDDAFEELTVERVWTFRQSETFRIFTMPYGFKESGGAVTFPDRTLFGSTHRLIQSVYPLDEELVSNVVMPLSKWDPDDRAFPPHVDPDNPPPGRFGQILDLSSVWGVIALLGDVKKRTERAALLSGQSFENNLGVGLLPMPASEVSPLDGYFNDFFQTTLGVSYSRNKTAVLVVEKNESFVPVAQVIAAHEIGHLFGLKDEYCFDILSFCDPTAPNSPPQSSAQGDNNGNFITESMLAYDVRIDPGVHIVPGRVRVFHSEDAAAHGYMGFPTGDVSTVWTGPTEYNVLFNALTVTPSDDDSQLSQSKRLSPQRTQQVTRNVIHLVGFVDKQGAGSIDSTFVGQTNAQLPELSGTGHSVAFLDDEGDSLGSVAFEVDYGVEIFGSKSSAIVEVDATPISVLVELPPGTAAIELREDGVATALDTVMKTSNIPTVAITDVLVRSDRMVEVTWQGDDADAGDILEYDVVYSPDGAVLSAVGTGLFGSSLTFDPVTEGGAVLAAGAFVRVHASDGFNNAAPDEAPLDVGGNGVQTGDIRWDATGVDVDKVVCKNKTTGQKARVDGGASVTGRCKDLGLVWNPGDNIQIKVVGTVGSVADAGGSITGINATLLVCKNRSTDPQEKVRVENPSLAWNCSEAGLPLAIGERLQWKAKGPAN